MAVLENAINRTQIAQTRSQNEVLSGTFIKPFSIHRSVEYKGKTYIPNYVHISNIRNGFYDGELEEYKFDASIINFDLVENISEDTTAGTLGGSGSGGDVQSPVNVVESIDGVFGQITTGVNLKIEDSILDTEDLLALSGVDIGDLEIRDGLIEQTAGNLSLKSAGDITLNANEGAGDVFLNGDVIKVDKQLSTADSIILINADDPGPSMTPEYAGLEINNPGGDNYFHVFRRDDEQIVIGDAGSPVADWQPLLTRQNSPTDKGLVFFDEANLQGVTDADLTFDADRLLFAGDAGFRSDSFDVDGGLIDGFDMDQPGNLRTASIEANSLVVKAFTAEVSQLFRGETTLSKSFGQIAADFVIPAVSNTGTLTIYDVDGFPGFDVFGNNDIVEIRPMNLGGGGLVLGSVFGRVTNVVDNEDGTQSWTWETLHAQNGALAGQTAYEGSEAKSYGSAASPVGVIQDSVFANTPFRQIYTWDTNPWTAGNRDVVYQHGDLDELGDGNVTGIGVYTKNIYATESVLIGDLDKPEGGTWLEFADGEMDLQTHKFLLSGVDQGEGVEIDSAEKRIAMLTGSEYETLVMQIGYDAANVDEVDSQGFNSFNVRIDDLPMQRVVWVLIVHLITTFTQR